jgi:hypothetical protein
MGGHVPKVHLAALFWIRQPDYARYRELCDDRDNLPAKYEKWVYAANKAFDQFQRQGLNVIKVEVDLDQFVAWCRSKNLDIDGRTRTRYANEIAAAQFKAKDQNKH